MSWRDTIKAHPAADLFPMMDGAELRTLADDIAKNGLQIKPVFWTDPIGVRWLIDGRNRLDAMEIAGISTDTEGREAPANADPHDLVVALNIHRRHLTGEQKRELIAKLVKAQPEKSDRQIATMAKVDHKTVGRVRSDGEASGEIPHISPQDRIDSGGRNRARKDTGSGKVRDGDPTQRATSNFPSTEQPAGGATVGTTAEPQSPVTLPEVIPAAMTPIERIGAAFVMSDTRAYQRQLRHVATRHGDELVKALPENLIGEAMRRLWARLSPAGQTAFLDWATTPAPAAAVQAPLAEPAPDVAEEQDTQPSAPTASPPAISTGFPS